jgi:CheY-like chemotaxis protein
MTTHMAVTPTVMVADDDAEIRVLVRQILEPCGCKVREASNGSEVLDEIVRTPVDLVILDLVMPGMEGIETLRALRMLRPELKVLVISGAFGGSFLHCAKLLGADASLKKPFSCDALIGYVERLVGTER